MLPFFMEELLCAVLFLVQLPFSSYASHGFRPPSVSDLNVQPWVASMATSEVSSKASSLTFFEVTQPLEPPNTKLCTHFLLNHSFANTYNRPPAMANYTPPASCGDRWGAVLLKWTGTCRGRQYDRIAAVWLGGVELLRTCTAEPVERGIVWQAKKDITRFSSLLRRPQLLVVELGNLVDRTYTGIFHISLSLEFYTPLSPSPSPPPADVILPISLPSPLSEGHWFQLHNSTTIASSSLLIPPNSYLILLEICVSFHGNDEFWYTNPPNEYIAANNLTHSPGNGAFREIQAFIDGKLVGAVIPFPVIYTGGINPLFWRPASAIGAYNLPTYELHITPFLGWLLDGESHVFGLRVENALDHWLVDANLHIWLDHKVEKTIAGLLEYHAPPYSFSLDLDFKNLDGSFHTTAKRTISSSGYVESSLGYMVMQAQYSSNFDNVIVFENNSDTQKVIQTIETGQDVLAKTGSEVLYSYQLSYSFPFNLNYLQYGGSNGSTVETCNLTHAFNRREYMVMPSYALFNSLSNAQQAEGIITISKENIVTSGIGALQQQYDFVSNLGCYYRSLSTKNYTILYDSSGTTCINSS